MNGHSPWVCPTSAEQVTSINTSMQQSGGRLLMLSNLEGALPRSRGCSICPSGFSPANQEIFTSHSHPCPPDFKSPYGIARKAGLVLLQLQWSCRRLPDSILEQHCLSCTTPLTICVTQPSPVALSVICLLLKLLPCPVICCVTSRT